MCLAGLAKLALADEMRDAYIKGAMQMLAFIAWTCMVWRLATWQATPKVARRQNRAVQAVVEVPNQDVAVQVTLDALDEKIFAQLTIEQRDELWITNARRRKPKLVNE